jgi:hypothetical protein
MVFSSQYAFSKKPITKDTAKVVTKEKINKDNSLYKTMKASKKFKKQEARLKGKKAKIHYDKAEKVKYAEVEADNLFIPVSEPGAKGESYLIYSKCNVPSKKGQDAALFMSFHSSGKKVLFTDENGKKMYHYKIDPNNEKLEVISGGKVSIRIPFISVEEARAGGWLQCQYDCLKWYYNKLPWWYRGTCGYVMKVCWATLIGSSGVGCGGAACCIGGPAIYCLWYC